MTFCSKEQKKEEIIRKIDTAGNNLIIEYMDGNQKKMSQEKQFELEDLMIKQAREREKLDYASTIIKKYGDTIIWLSSSGLLYKSLNAGKYEMLFIGLLLATYFFIRTIENSNKLKELKKYRILLKNYKELKENQDLNKIVEIDSYYRKPIDIFNIDDYSLNNIEEINEALKKRLKNKK